MRKRRWLEPICLLVVIALWGAYSRSPRPAPDSAPLPPVASVPGPKPSGSGSRDHLVRGLAIHYVGLGETLQGARQLFRNHAMTESVLDRLGTSPETTGLLRLAVRAPEGAANLVATFVDGRVCSLEGDDLENNEVDCNQITMTPGLYARVAETYLGKPVGSRDANGGGRVLTYRCAGVDGRICRVQVKFDQDDRARRCRLEDWTHVPERCKCGPVEFF